jgi:hypothetical protein
MCRLDPDGFGFLGLNDDCADKVPSSPPFATGRTMANLGMWRPENTALWND